MQWIHMRLPVTVGYPLPYPPVHHNHQRGTQSSDCLFHRQVYTLDSAQSAFASIVRETVNHTKKESATQGLNVIDTNAVEKQVLYDVFGAEILSFIGRSVGVTQRSRHLMVSN
ncbi:hypothetical protein PTI98_011320 [Pleurotus ostreatus]|nr:hypothetical protein PTI98_011320 [Pleurotus ostreatus]